MRCSSVIEIFVSKYVIFQNIYIFVRALDSSRHTRGKIESAAPEIYDMVA